MLKSNKGKGPGSLLIGFVEAKDQLVSCCIRMDETRKRLDEIEAGCLKHGIEVHR